MPSAPPASFSDVQYRATLERIPDGRPGLLAKVRKIRELVESAKRDPNFRAAAARLVDHVAEKDHDGEIGAVTDFVRGAIRYLRDPYAHGGLELFTTPQALFRDALRGTAIGDCDDHVLLESALLEVLGYPTRYRVGGLPPDHYRHIWIEAKHPGRGWLAIELTKKDRPVGWDPSAKFPLTETFESGQLTGDDVDYEDEPMRTVLGALPPSFLNVQPYDEALYAGATPSDFFRAVGIRNMIGVGAPALLDYDELAGFKLKKVFRPIKKLGSKAVRVVKKVGVGTVVGVALAPFTGGASLAIGASLDQARKAQKQAKAAAQAQAQYDAQYDAQGMVEAAPASPSAIPLPQPPSFAQQAPGYALAPGQADEMFIDNEGGLMPEYEQTESMPLPGGEEGSYVPTPRDFGHEPALSPFSVESDGGGGDTDPGFGMGRGSEALFHEATMDNRNTYGGIDTTFGGLGAESWLTELGKALTPIATTAAQTALQYQQAKLGARAQQKYGATPAFFARSPIPTSTQAPTGPRTFNLSGVALPLAIAVGAFFLLSGRSRRR